MIEKELKMMLVGRGHINFFADLEEREGDEDLIPKEVKLVFHSFLDVYHPTQDHIKNQLSPFKFV